MMRDAAVFPQVSGRNLDRKSLTFPRDFEGELNIVMVAFQQWQQRHVDTWIPLARELERKYPNVRHYEFPTIWRMGPIRRWFINEGMRAGIPDAVARARTVTLYLDKQAFRRSLRIEDESDVTVLLVDGRGTVLWRAWGKIEAETEAALRAAIESHQHEEE